MSGPAILGIVLAVVAVLGLLWLWFRAMMRKLTALWAPNTRLVQGVFSRWRAMLRGAWQGRPVVAYLANENPDGDGTASSTYSYIVRMTFPSGFENWSAVCRARKGQAPAWQVKAGSGTAERLAAAGLMAALEQAPKNCRFRWRAGKGRMQLSIGGVGMYFCPDVQAFEAQLDLLARLGAITLTAAGTELRQAA